MHTEGKNPCVQLASQRASSVGAGSCEEGKFINLLMLLTLCPSNDSSPEALWLEYLIGQGGICRQSSTVLRINMAFRDGAVALGVRDAVVRPLDRCLSVALAQQALLQSSVCLVLAAWPSPGFIGCPLILKFPFRIPQTFLSCSSSLSPSSCSVGLSVRCPSRTRSWRRNPAALSRDAELKPNSAKSHSGGFRNAIFKRTGILFSRGRRCIGFSCNPESVWKAETREEVSWGSSAFGVT